MRSFFLLAPLAATTFAFENTSELEIPDALPTEELKTIADPTNDIIPGYVEQTVYYDLGEAIATVSADISSTPLSVFPASTGDAINAAGDSAVSEATATTEDVTPSATETGTPARRNLDFGQLVVRDACAPEPTKANNYNVTVTSYAAFKADAKIASIANTAPTPAGYFQNFNNADGASSASAYLGYQLLSSYDVEYCAKKCTEKSGCLAFNIFFERDPTVTPGTGCENPPGTANIKCTLWGVPLSLSTAKNKGQFRAQFQVGIAGSNAYTSYTIGGPVEGYSAPASLSNAAMNAPLRDCAGTWAYMGYKIYSNQPFDPRLCSAACDSQTVYNLAHPPASGSPSKCGAFGTYLVHKQTPSSGSVITGQMCTLYTSNFASSYAKNMGSTDGDGTKWTFSHSFWYAKADRQPVCNAVGRRLRRLRK